MIVLALDTASDRCSVAVSSPDGVAHRAVDGARQHAREVLALAGEALASLGAEPLDVTRILSADGPGSFTGLRVSTTVAKALLWRRPEVSWATAPSLLVRARAHLPESGGTVLALSDALRGELHAGCWRWSDGRVQRVGPSAPPVTPDRLAEFGPVDVVVGTVPPALVDAVHAATKRSLIGGHDALPDARWLLELDTADRATTEVTDAAAWSPVYGRLAEAQVVWERKHGRSLPAPTDRQL